MANAAPGPGTSLQIRRIFAAPREKVFAAWTQRQGVEQWMCRDVPSHQVVFPEFDVKTGGRYVIDVKDTKTGVEYVGRGTYLEVKPPEKLVFTWGWTKKQSDRSDAILHPETEVTVEFHARGESTEVVLTHTGFQTTKEHDDTNTGWNGCFDVLEAFLKA
jgi:uncharacterized protein YndB with AHSA1/START domain